MGNVQLLIATLAVLMASSAVPIMVVEAQVGQGPLANIVTPAFFDGIRNRAPNNCPGKSFYTREAFLQAARSYPLFAIRGLSPEASRREIAAFFAHVTHETENMCNIEQPRRGIYCDPGRYPCAKGKRYYGRGPLQLTWNYNYAEAGRANGFDGIGDPDMVARDPILAWKTALWFWMTQVRPVLNQGFGATIRRINGGECNGGNVNAVRARVGYYSNYCHQLGVNVETNVSC
ncbi:Chitinase 4 [Linum grandiflorum]